MMHSLSKKILSQDTCILEGLLIVEFKKSWIYFIKISSIDGF